MELLNNCDWTWTAKNGVNGYTVIDKNGKSIFLPAADFCVDPEFSNDCKSGLYWSSSLHASYSYRARSLFISSDDQICTYENRYYGISVRAVTE